MIDYRKFFTSTGWAKEPKFGRIIRDELIRRLNKCFEKSPTKLQYVAKRIGDNGLGVSPSYERDSLADPMVWEVIEEMEQELWIDASIKPGDIVRWIIARTIDGRIFLGKVEHMPEFAARCRIFVEKLKRMQEENTLSFDAMNEELLKLERQLDNGEFRIIGSDFEYDFNILDAWCPLDFHEIYKHYSPRES